MLEAQTTEPSVAVKPDTAPAAAAVGGTPEDWSAPSGAHEARSEPPNIDVGPSTQHTEYNHQQLAAGLQRCLCRT